MYNEHIKYDGHIKYNGHIRRSDIMVLFDDLASCFSQFFLIMRFSSRGKEKDSYQKFNMKMILYDRSEIKEPGKNDKILKIVSNFTQESFFFSFKQNPG